MSVSRDAIRTATDLAAKQARNELAHKRAESNLRDTLTKLAQARSALFQSDADRYLREAEVHIENAEAWIAYLQDPSIIEPERNLPA